MKRASYVLTLLFLLAALPLLSGHGAEQKKASIMQKKLQHAQKVLEGFAVKDFKKISNNADELLFLSKEQEWKVLSTPGYERYSNEFRRNAQTLIKNAEDEDLDACVRSYTDMTLTSVNCHKHVREVGMGQGPRGPNRLTVSTPSSQ
jgi:hypothetical protein